MVVLRLGTIFLNFIYIFLKLLPTKNKIVFISRQTDKPSIDFRMLISEINKINKNIKIVTVTNKTKKTLKDGIKNIKYMFIQMYHLATSKVCVIDGYNITISVLKHKKSLKVIQIWHSLAAIKKFGYQSLNSEKQKKIAKTLKMHKNYDYIISGSEYMTPYFAEAFNYDEIKFKTLGLPRIDYLLNNSKINKKRIYQKYPQMKNQKIILYAPTFRDNNNYKINELINAIDLNKYLLVVKLHPLMDYNLDKKKNVYTCDEFSSLQLLSVADYVITDYSAISVEALVLDKPVYLYVYDIQEYIIDPGINMDLNQLFGKYVFEDEKDLIKTITNSNYDSKLLNTLKSKLVCNVDGNVTKNLANFIIESGILDETKVKK